MSISKSNISFENSVEFSNLHLFNRDVFMYFETRNQTEIIPSTQSTGLLEIMRIGVRRYEHW